MKFQVNENDWAIPVYIRFKVSGWNHLKINVTIVYAYFLYSCCVL